MRHHSSMGLSLYTIRLAARSAPSSFMGADKVLTPCRTGTIVSRPKVCRISSAHISAPHSS